MPSDNRSMKARAKAVSDLISNHKEEFDRLYGDAREAAGLPRVVGGLSPEAKQTRIAKHIAALKALGVDVPTTNA
jgi:hypothetical protein